MYVCDEPKSGFHPPFAVVNIGGRSNLWASGIGEVLMIACFDVGYSHDNATGITRATAACVTISDWTSTEIQDEIAIEIPRVQEYVPGEFYRRELPCILAVMDRLKRAPLQAVVVDGYVWLSPDGKRGLGAHLYDALERETPIVGVAKTRFQLATNAISVLRGTSQQPLFVTSEGIAPAEAADQIRQMAGPHRLPMALRRVDQLSKCGPLGS